MLFQQQIVSPLFKVTKMPDIKCFSFTMIVTRKVKNTASLQDSVTSAHIATELSKKSEGFETAFSGRGINFHLERSTRAYRALLEAYFSQLVGRIIDVYFRARSRRAAAEEVRCSV